MSAHGEELDPTFEQVVERLLEGSFSRLGPSFAADQVGGRAPILEWHDAGRFAAHPGALAEALTCACFLGRADVATYLLDRGVEPSAGNKTGLNAFHWAVNRGQLEVVQLLIRRQLPLETCSMYNGTVLGTAVWSAMHEHKP